MVVGVVVSSFDRRFSHLLFAVNYLALLHPKTESISELNAASVAGQLDREATSLLRCELHCFLKINSRAMPMFLKHMRQIRSAE